MSEQKSIYINPLTDFGFKFLFGQEENKEFLLSFLNALMIGEPTITDVEFVDKEKVNENKDGRALIYDLHCTMADGSRIIVEMQNRYQTYFEDRALYYLAGDLYLQSKQGNLWKYQLVPVYGVFMMNFEWKGDLDQQLREDVGLLNMRTHKLFSNKLRMTFLKIPMMTKDAQSCENMLEKWTYLMKNLESLESMPKLFMRDPVFQRLDEVAKVSALNPKDKKDYEESLKIYHDNYAIAETERAEGLAEGRERGRAEEKRAIARGLLKLGMTDEAISQVTKLPVSQVAALRASL